MRILTRALTALCVVVVSATCTDHPARNPTEPEIEPQFAKGNGSLQAGALRLCKEAA